MRKKERAAIVIERLKKEYPGADCTLDYNEAWKLLVSVRLAAQCTDERVNIIVKDLFAKYPGVNELAEAEPEDIEAIVRPCGLGKSKARDISKCMRMLRDEFGSKVPDNFEDLLKLPGVGRKSANLIMGDVFGKPAIATDRISAFDVILKNEVKDKGAILTQMSKFWFNLTENTVPNHMISTDVKDMPEFFQNEKYAGRSMMCKKLEMFPVECIVRGYITGSGWASYQENGTVCGIKLPEGLQESEKLPEPIYTPSTKADLGDHDENVSYDKTVEILEKLYPGKGNYYANILKEYTISLYKKCAEYAWEKGIIIADTKFEFGLDEQGRVVIGDEMLTPDSSRFWPREGYEAGKGQPSYDKQFVRDWLKQNPDSDYDLPEEVIDKTVAKYKEAYEQLTGEPFEA